MPIKKKEAHIVGMDLAKGISGDGPMRRAKKVSQAPKSIILRPERGQRSMTQPQMGALVR
jgi:hypothetical protein